MARDGRVSRGRTGSKFITRLKRCTIYARDGEHCVYCVRRVKIAQRVGYRHKRAATIDHVNPNGGNGYDNLVTACWQCNHEKSDKLDSWHASAAGKANLNNILPWMRERGRKLCKHYYPTQSGGRKRRQTTE